MLGLRIQSVQIHLQQGSGGISTTISVPPGGEAFCISISQKSPVWMTSALQGKNALIARLVSTVLCPAFDRGIRLSRWP